MSQHATPWPRMIRAVYDSFDTGRHQGDAVARRVMDRIVSWLTAGLELSPRLQAKLLDNINMRTSYRVTDPVTPVRLTRNQLAYAMKTNPEWFDLGLHGEDEPAEIMLKDGIVSTAIPQVADSFQHVFSSLSSGIQHSFSSFSALFPQHAMHLAQQLVSIASESAGSGATSSPDPSPKVMEWEGNQTNHEGDMSWASPALAFHDQSGADPASHEPQVDDEQGACRDVGGSHCQDGTAHRDTHASKTHRPSLTLWIKEDEQGTTHATGYFDRDGDKFALRFTAFDHALERIGTGDAAWHKFANTQIGPEVLPAERSATGIAATATFSGLYARSDTWARKAPVFQDKAVALSWSGTEPTHAFLIEGQQITEVELRRESNQRYKGLVPVVKA